MLPLTPHVHSEDSESSKPISTRLSVVNPLVNPASFLDSPFVLFSLSPLDFYHSMASRHLVELSTTCCKYTVMICGWRLFTASWCACSGGVDDIIYILVGDLLQTDIVRFRYCQLLYTINILVWPIVIQCSSANPPNPSSWTLGTKKNYGHVWQWGRRAVSGE